MSSDPAGDVALPIRLRGAWRWLQRELAGRPVPALVVVIGLRDTNLLEALEQQAPATRVLALEPDADAAALFRANDLVRPWLTSSRLTHLIGPEYLGAEEAWRLLTPRPDDHVLLVSPILARSADTGAVQAAQVLKRIVFGARANAEARREFAPRYLENSLRNLADLLAGRDVRDLAGAFAGLPAVIAAAGPSLDAVLPQIADVRDHALVISVDTALRPLLAAGISPHLVAALDPSALNARHFDALPPCPDTWLLAESALAPSAVQQFADRTFWFRVADHEPWPWYNTLGFDVGHLQVWGSVLTGAFQAAVLAGCDPIVFVGADLAFTDGRPYCRGTTYEFAWAQAVVDGRPLEQIWSGWAAARGRVASEDLRGRTTETTPALLAFRDWLLAHAIRSGRRIINATGAGILNGAGVEIATLANAVTKRGRVRPLASLPRTAGRLRAADVATQVEALAEAIATSPAHAIAQRWATFTGAGWNAAAIAEALAESAATLVQEPRRTADQPPRASSSPAASHLSADLVRILPEAVARWRAALAGTPALGSLPAGTPTSPTTAQDCLATAFTHLIAICQRLLAGDATLASALTPSMAGRELLSASPAWPDAVRWDLLMFESLLGAVAVPFAHGDDYFARPILLAERPSPLAAGEASQVDAAMACASLAIAWAICDVSVTVEDETARRQRLDWLRLLRGALEPQVPVALTSSDTDSALVLRHEGPDGVTVIDIPVTMADGGLARLHTGLLQPVAPLVDSPASSPRTAAGGASGDESLFPLATVDSAQDSWSVCVRGSRMRPRTAPARTLAADAPLANTAPHDERFVPVRVLSDDGFPKAFVAYSTDRGVVCFTPCTASTFLLREDVVMAPAREWPYPIVGEMPFGTDGAIAWSHGDGSGTAPAGGPGYVMYQTGRTTPVITEPLPFSPQMGHWWQGRMYWSCYPYGVASWAPGEEPRYLAEDMAFWTVEPDEDTLLFLPRARDGARRSIRRLLTQGRRLHGTTGQLDNITFGRYGARSHRARAHGWTASAHVEADTILLEGPNGTLALTCYCPHRLAWVGRSLLVSTCEASLLLFPRLADHLDASLSTQTLAQPAIVERHR